MIEILKFYTDTCVPCKVVGKILDKIEGIKVIPINAIEEKDKSTEYDIIATPTLIFLKEGKQVGRLSGLQSETVIKTYIKECEEK